jgi:hypothetical protein
MQSYAKPYPTDEFLRKFYYYNTIWLTFKSTLKHNISADNIKKNLLKKNPMLQKLVNRKYLDSIRLPYIFSNKKAYIKDSKMS